MHVYIYVHTISFEGLAEKVRTLLVSLYGKNLLLCIERNDLLIKNLSNLSLLICTTNDKCLIKF